MSALFFRSPHFLSTLFRSPHFDLNRSTQAAQRMSSKSPPWNDPATRRCTPKTLSRPAPIPVPKPDEKTGKKPDEKT